jgi:hypothetical protein
MRYKRYKFPGCCCVCRKVRKKRTKRTKSGRDGISPQNGTIFLPTSYVLANVPSVILRPCYLAWDGLGLVSSGVGVFRIVKTAQSRGRTERTLLTALSQLLWRDKGREVWFSLGENHVKACRLGLHSLRNCFWRDFCSPQARPREGAGMLRTGVIRHFDIALLFATPKSSCWQALMLSRWLAADARAERTGARPSRAVVARRP